MFRGAESRTQTVTFEHTVGAQSIEASRLTSVGRKRTQNLCAFRLEGGFRRSCDICSENSCLLSRPQNNLQKSPHQFQVTPDNSLEAHTHGGGGNMPGNPTERFAHLPFTCRRARCQGQSLSGASPNNQALCLPAIVVIITLTCVTSGAPIATERWESQMSDFS